LAWQSQEEVGRCLDAALTMLAVVASQALHVTSRDSPPELAELLAMVRAEFPPVTESRTLAMQLATLMERLRMRIYDADLGQP
jgi:histidine ammonia-lyase